jgi:hypothetical protein
VSPLTDYLDQLEPLLRRGGRRRILAEVRAHLLDAAAAAGTAGEDPIAAQRRAIARFGSPAEVARAFNALRRRPRAFVRRASAVLLATASTASVGTATVWALEPGGAHRGGGAERAHHAAARHAHRAGHDAARDHRRLP